MLISFNRIDQLNRNSALTLQDNWNHFSLFLFTNWGYVGNPHLYVDVFHYVVSSIAIDRLPNCMPGQQGCLPKALGYFDKSQDVQWVYATIKLYGPQYLSCKYVTGGSVVNPARPDRPGRCRCTRRCRSSLGLRDTSHSSLQPSSETPLRRRQSKHKKLANASSSTLFLLSFCISACGREEKERFSDGSDSLICFFLPNDRCHITIFSSPYIRIFISVVSRIQIFVQKTIEREKQFR